MNWLSRTHQTWKVVASLGLLAAAGACFVLWFSAFADCNGPVFSYCAAADRGVAFMLSGTGLGLVGLVWASLSVRCPVCGTRIIWWAMSKKAAGVWLTAVRSLEACPKCGNNGAL